MPGIEGVERENLHDCEVRGIVRNSVDGDGQPGCPGCLGTIAVRGALLGVGD